MHASFVAENPISGDDNNPSRTLVAFVGDKLSLATLEPISALATPPDKFFLGSRAAYAYCEAGSLVSPVGVAFLGKPGRAAITRNWATTLKMHALANAA